MNVNVRVCDMHHSSTTLRNYSRVSQSPSPSSSSLPYHLLHPRLTTFRSCTGNKNNNPNIRFRAKCSLVSVVEAPAQTSAESVSRRLILLRHAKSSWDNRSLRDHDRPLSKSGRVDAEKISQKLKQLGWIPELILCSDAARSKETLKIMQEHVQELLEAEVHFVSSFYSIAAMDGQTAEHLQKVICRYSRDEILTVMCMGHNRGWEEAASMFSGASIELKTCNAALLEAAGKSWAEAFAAAGFGGWKLQGIVKPSS